MGDLSQALFPTTAWHPQVLGTGGSSLHAGRAEGCASTPCPWESQPHCSAPRTEIWLPDSSVPLAMSLRGGSKTRVASPSTMVVQKLGKLGKGQLPLALLALALFPMASSPDTWLSEQEFLVYVLFFSHFRERHRNKILSFHQLDRFGLQLA